MAGTPKKALIVLCHPNRSGFNPAIARAAEGELKKDHLVDFIDLYRSGFDPTLPPEELPRKFSFDETVLKFNVLAQEASVLVFVHPDWWGGPPALLKGLVDRVFRPGIAYDFDGPDFLSKKKVELFRGKKALVFNTTDYPPPQGIDPSAEVWKKNIFGYCGIDDAQVHTFYDTYGSTYEARKAWIQSVGTKIRDLL